MHKEIGYIEKVTFGKGGYNDDMIGILLCFKGKNWIVNDDRLTWDWNIVKDEWIKDRDIAYRDMVIFLSKLLSDAKVNTIEELVGIPVEIEFDRRNSIVDFNIIKK